MRHRGSKLLEAGDTVPDLRLRTLDGGEQSLLELAATGPVLLSFFKISCPVCQLTLPFLERIHPEKRVAGISQNGAKETREFNKHYGLTFPTLLDLEHDDFPVSNAFGITHVPTTFLVEPGGRIAHVIEGWNKKEMEVLGAIRPGDHVPAWKAG
jgi:peroxiredoxin